jgi:hypothetical protein
VDAIYRLAFPLPQNFRSDRRVALGSGSWCPFNSQNTAWWPETYPLLYLPAHCSFRMTDIWRSFVAQRIAWANGWSILFHEPTVWQDRNDHSLMRDFADEVPGYLHNRAMGAALAELNIQPGTEHLGDNLRMCYETLVKRGWVGADEMALSTPGWLISRRSRSDAAPSPASRDSTQTPGFRPARAVVRVASPVSRVASPAARAPG